MVLKWLNNNGNTELLFLDSVSKFVLMSNSILAYDAFNSAKTISTGAFKKGEDASRTLDEIVRRLNVFGSTDDAVETDYVFDVQDFLENNGNSW